MIKTDGLTKRYGSVTAVDNLSFSVEAGEVLGFLGPNGAGKTTSMRMIAGFLTPTSGTATVCGHDVEAESIAAKSCIGYLPEGAPSYPEMTPLAFLEFIADVRGLSGSRRRERLDDVIDRLQLEGVIGQSIETLSKGFKRRVGLAQAILHDPEVLVLDEPTDGLDPNQKHEVRKLIRSISRNKTIVISTHILEEVHALCTRAVIIARGRLLADDTPAALEARSRYHNAVTMKLAGDIDLGTVSASVEALPQVSGVELNGTGDRITAFPHDGQLLLPAITEMVNQRQWPLDELHLEAGRLDEVFRDITTREEASA